MDREKPLGKFLLTFFLSAVCFLLLVFSIFPSTTLIVKKKHDLNVAKLTFILQYFFGEFICGILIMYLFNYFSQLIKLLIKFNRDHAVYLTFKLISFKKLGPPPKKRVAHFGWSREITTQAGWKKIGEHASLSIFWSRFQSESSLLTGEKGEETDGDESSSVTSSTPEG